MAGTIKDYRKMVEEPWGRMFYEQVFRQIPVSDDKRLKILDFGAGFCITAGHCAEHHDVTALEPNEEMYEQRVEGDYTLVTQGVEYLSTVEDKSYDVVLCHNVLEYTDDKDRILKELVRVLKPGGSLSVIKHNLYGRVMASAVLGDDPKTALSLLCSDDAENSMFGNRSVYDNEYLINFMADEMDLKEIYGIRSFFGLSSNNDIKYSDDWFLPMLELENKASTIEEYRKVAFFNHLIFSKRG